MKFRTAQKYALALYRVMEEKDRLDETREEFDKLISFLNQNKEIKNFLYNYPVKEDLKSEIVKGLVSESSEDFLRFLILIVQKKRFKLLEMIAEEYARLVNKVQNVEVALVATPMPLEEDQKEEIVKALAEMSGKEIKLEEKIDPDIKGGFVINMGGKLFDASLTAQLEKMFQQITA